MKMTSHAGNVVTSHIGNMPVIIDPVEMLEKAAWAIFELSRRPGAAAGPWRKASRVEADRGR
jgi:hypothetical protein